MRLRQVLTNLVGNAIKFTEVGSVEMRISCRLGDPARLRFDVVDTGIGMTRVQCEQLFEPFSQADSSVTRRFGGTGLGLGISRRLARMLGGEITAASVVGHGSTLSVEIVATVVDGTPIPIGPLSLAPDGVDERALADAAAGDRSLEGVRVLLAEDGADNVRLITHVLQKAGATVAAVGNGALAVQALTVDGSLAGDLRLPAPFDLVVTDIQMPEMDGYALAARLREKGCRLPVLALTAHAMAGDRERCLQAGCTSYASKPIKRRELLAACAAAMRAAGVCRPVPASPEPVDGDPAPGGDAAGRAIERPAPAR